jgi:hypothetical protein
VFSLADIEGVQRALKDFFQKMPREKLIQEWSETIYNSAKTNK